MQSTAPLSPASCHSPFDVRPLTPSLGAEISGVDLTQGTSAELFATEVLPRFNEAQPSRQPALADVL